MWSCISNQQGNRLNAFAQVNHSHCNFICFFAKFCVVQLEHNFQTWCTISKVCCITVMVKVITKLIKVCLIFATLPLG